MARVYRLWALAFLLSVVAHAMVTWYVGDELGAPAQAPQRNHQIEILDVPGDPEPPAERLKFERFPEIDPPEQLLTNSATVVNTAVSPSLRAARGGQPVGIGPGAGVVGEITQTLGTGLGDGADQFAQYVEDLREAGLDVLFLVDATGSMGWALDEVKNRVRDMVEWVRELVPIARFGVVAYRDIGDPEFVTRLQPLTYSTAKLERFMGRLQAAGGGNLGESVLSGMRVAVAEAGWRASGKRLIILIGDAPPHRDDAGELLRVVSGFKDRGGQVTTLDVSDDANPALLEAKLKRRVNRAMYRGAPSYDFTRIADAGGGDAATLDGDTHLVRRVVVLIFGHTFSDDLALALEALEAG